ncbi:MAG: TolC family protein [Deltaproteobacteria bacterium]|nr:TolC family protein [Deltaproteobacteria bacterium]
MRAQSLFPVLLVSWWLTSGCASSSRDRAWLDAQLNDRLGGTTGGEDARRAVRWPEDVTLEDGLDEREVVALALTRSPMLRADLARIDAARASLDEANRPANPQLSLMGPFGPVTAVATLLAPLESLWQMPDRAAAAARDADAAGESALMSALTIARDARLLHVELALAQDRAAVRTALRMAADELARVGEVRARLGEATPLEAELLAVDASNAIDAATIADNDVIMARARLSAALALDDAQTSGDWRAVFEGETAVVDVALDQLLAAARSLRPDARAAEIAIDAAASRAGWERSRVIALGALVEGQWSEAIGPSLRVGARLDLPIFGLNPGGIGRAEAEILRATALLDVTIQTVASEVRVAHARALQAERSRRLFDAEVLPSLEASLRMAQAGFLAGDAPSLIVLDVLRRISEARLRRADLVAEARRARAELERAIGGRLARVTRQETP